MEVEELWGSFGGSGYCPLMIRGGREGRGGVEVRHELKRRFL